MAGYAGELAVKVTADTRAMTRQITQDATTAGTDAGKGFGRSFASTAKRIIGAAAIGLAIKKTVDFIGDSTRAASDLAESVNAVNVVYQKFGDDAPAELAKIADASARTYGLSKKDFNGMAVQFSSFADRVAGPGGDVVGIIEDLTGRSADFASVMNLDVAEAARVFQSALAGETEPIKKFGIDLSAASVEAYAVANGITESGRAMTEAEKVQARYGLLMESTADTAGDFANTSDGLANRQRIFAASLEDAKAKMGEAFLPIAEKVVGWAQEKFLPAFQDVAAFVSERLVPGFQGLIDLLFRGDFTEGFAQAFGVQEDSPVVGVLFRIRDAFMSMIDFVRDEVVPVLRRVFQWIADNKDTLLQFAAGVAAVVAGFLAVRKVISVIQAVRGAILLLNAAMLANPIGLIVAAIAALIGALVVAYNKVGWFRDFVDKVFAKIKEVVGVVVDWIVETAWPAIQQAWDVLSEAISQVWENVLKPVFRTVARVASWLWESVLKPVFRFIGDAWSALVAAIKFVWERILKPVWERIVGVIRWVWSVLSWLFDLWRTGWEILIGAIRWVWNNVLRPVFDAVGSAVRALWDRFIKPIFTWIGDKWDWLVKRVFKPVWDFLKRNVFDPLGRAVDAAKEAFNKAKDAIAAAWERVKSAAAKPILFVIDTVINQGIIRTINNVAEFFTGKRPISPVTIPAGLKSAAKGGATSVPAQAFGGFDFLGAARAVAKFLTDPKGAIEDAIRSLLAQIEENPVGAMVLGAVRKTVGYAVDWIRGMLFGADGPVGKGKIMPAGTYTIGVPYAGYPGHKGQDLPAPVGTPVFAAYPGVVGWTESFNYSTSYGRVTTVEHAGNQRTRYAHLSSVAVRPGQVVQAGQLLGWSGNTGNSTGPHLHLEWWKNGVRLDPRGLGVFDQGGYLAHGGMGVNLSGQPERVLSPAETRALETLQIPLAGGRWRDQGPPVVNVYIGDERLNERIDYRVEVVTGDAVTAGSVTRRGYS